MLGTPNNNGDYTTWKPPEEFFEVGDKRSRWSFIYKDYFKDCLSEAEKGRLHDGLRTIRRMEFEATIVKELLRDEMQEQEEEDFGRAPVKASGGTVTYGATSSASAQQHKAKMRQGLMKAQSNAALGKKP